MPETEENSPISFERIVFFSDAVFAIVITLLVLEIKVPHIPSASSEALHKELARLVPKFLGFVCSFFIVGLIALFYLLSGLRLPRAAQTRQA